MAAPLHSPGTRPNVRPVRSAARRPGRAQPSAAERVRRAWLAHPALAIFRHRRQHALVVQLHTLVTAGIGVPQTLSALATGSSPAERRRLTAVGQQLADGALLSDALRAHPGLLDPTSVAVVTAAERAGTLDASLRDLDAALDHAQMLRRRVVLVSLYPLFLLGSAWIGGAALSGASAAATSGLAGVGDAVIGSLMSGLVRGLSCVAAVIAFPLVCAALDIERPVNELMLRLPLVSMYLRNVYASRMLATLGRTIGAGLEAVASLELAFESSGSAAVRARMQRAVEALRAGTSLTDAVAVSGVVGGDALRQLSIGETTGSFDRLLPGAAEQCAAAAQRVLIALLWIAAGVVVVLAVASAVHALIAAESSRYHQLDQLMNTRP